ncbi:hypothetical protein Nmel_007485 [Mimus melanotis]
MTDFHPRCSLSSRLSLQASKSNFSQRLMGRLRDV